MTGGRTRILAVRTPPGADLRDGIAAAVAGTVTLAGDTTIGGGYLLHGCRMRTTAEVVIGLIASLRLARRCDPANGHAEVVVSC